MFIVYALYSSSHDKIYVGYSSNLQERLRSHNELAKKGWTVRYRPWEVIYQEKQPTKSKALLREKQLKSAKGREFIWELVRAKYPQSD